MEADNSTDAAVERLAQQLAQLRSNWPNQWSEAAAIDCNNSANLSSPVSPVDSAYSFFSAPFFNDQVTTTNNDNSRFSYNMWETDDDDFGSTQFYGRYSDTPHTWPAAASDEIQQQFFGGDRNSMLYDSGIVAQHWGGAAPSTNTTTAQCGGRRRSSDPPASAPFPMTQQDVQEWVRALEPPTPGPGYICRICHGNDHYVQNCPRTPPKSEMNTPYQGYNQCYGVFNCACGKEWDSHKSWAEMGQICRRCKQLVFPNKQFPLDKIPPSALKKRNMRTRSGTLMTKSTNNVRIW